MGENPKVLAFSGSLREHSFTRRVLKTAIEGAQKEGASVTFIDLRDFPMPIYNPDDQDKYGIDENALKFQKLLSEHDGLLIATPEYNGSLPGVLKNAIDWGSRQNDRYKKSDLFQGKAAAIITASPGSFGGLRCLAHLRGVLSILGVHVLPTEIAIPFVNRIFDGDSEEMADEKMKQQLENLGKSLAVMLRKF